MAGATKSEEVAEQAKRVGVASVRKMYRWVGNHVHAAAGADIEWKKGRQSKFRLFAQVPQLQALQAAIEATSEETEETVEMRGTLVGLDVETRKFHMKFPEGEDVKGEMSPAIGTKHTLELPKDYTATVLVKRKIRYSTETEEASYFLLDIK
jgi:hypothetical protein